VARRQLSEVRVNILARTEAITVAFHRQAD
jgi:hypothetical protein